MANGGFIFRKHSITSVTADYPNKKAFADAFMLGYVKSLIEASGGTWGDTGTLGYWRIDTTRHSGANTTQSYIENTDFINCNGNNSCGFSVFLKSENNEAFVIIVNQGGFSTNPAQDNATYLYIHKSNLPHYGGSSWSIFDGVGFAYCPSGLDFLGNTPGTENFCPVGGTRIHGIFPDWRVNDMSTANTGSGVFNANPGTGRIFNLGMLVRANVVIPMGRAEGMTSPHLSWKWILFGDVITTMVNQGDTRKVCVLSCYTYLSRWETSGSTSEYIPIGADASSQSQNLSSMDVSRQSRSFYNSSTAEDVVEFTGYQNIPGVPFFSYSTVMVSASSVSSELTSEIPYTAIYCSAMGLSESNPLVDGQGHGGKGFISTEVLRAVSRVYTQTPGTLYDGGNFINFGYDLILGWDPSNESPF